MVVRMHMPLYLFTFPRPKFFFFFFLSVLLYQEYAEAGTVKQNYVNILLMLLRLRQACDHPLLVNGEYSFTWESSVGLAKKQIQSEASLAICGICNVRFFCLVNYYTCVFFS